MNHGEVDSSPLHDFFIRSEASDEDANIFFWAYAGRNGCFLLTCGREKPNSGVGTLVFDSPECRSAATQACKQEGRSMDRSMAQARRSQSRIARKAWPVSAAINAKCAASQHV